MTVVEVKKWCEDNWAIIKVQHITLTNHQGTAGKVW
jgi:hypothetical protein